MEELEKLKLRLDIDLSDTSKDVLLNQVLVDAQAEILDYCNRDTLLEKLNPLVRELAIIYYNRMGSEGESSRSEGNISVSYVNDMPENIKARLKAYRSLKLARMVQYES